MWSFGWPGETLLVPLRAARGGGHYERVLCAPRRTVPARVGWMAARMPRSGTVTGMATSLTTPDAPAAGDVACAGEDVAADSAGAAAAAPVSGRGDELLPEFHELVSRLAGVGDPVARARAATRLLAEVEKARLVVAETRRVAVADTGLGPRALERALGISITAAADLRRAAAGGSRRSTR